VYACMYLCMCACLHVCIAHTDEKGNILSTPLKPNMFRLQCGKKCLILQAPRFIQPQLPEEIMAISKIQALLRGRQTRKSLTEGNNGSVKLTHLSRTPSGNLPAKGSNLLAGATREDEFLKQWYIMYTCVCVGTSCIRVCV
jgi:hypothetical protein